MNISLGYEIGTGKRVTIPVNHTVVLGQTQLSGKTTTLEAMVERSGLRAVGFITKPGEKSFRLQTQIPAFFSEVTIEEYWKHVVAILEYRSGVRLGWRERGVVMKLCQKYEKESSRIGMDKKSGKTKREAVNYSWRAPKSLRELLENIEIWMPYTRGQEEMICMMLREYLRPAIAEIDRAEFSDKLKLAPGINVMDLTELSDGLKSLVIRSVIEWVHKHGRKIVVIIPEAWKFIPEGRSTPVKLALEGLIREGGGIENFVWMDSQDLRGVDKMLLRSVIVWLFGVQRQKNEVASTLASIPDHPKPTATEVMQLGKGQFYVCYGTTLKHTYVQPAGMEDAHAQAIARGEESPDSWRQIERALDYEAKDEAGERTETPESETDSAGIRGRDNDQAEARTDVSDAVGSVSTDASDSSGIAVSLALESTAGSRSDDAREYLGGRRENTEAESTADEARAEEIEETMRQSAPNPTPITQRFRDYLKNHVVANDLVDNLVPFLAEYDALVEAHDALAARLRILESRSAGHESRTTELRSPSGASAGERLGLAPADEGGAGAADASRALGTAAPAPANLSEVQEQIYRYIIARAEKDPRVLAVLVNRPELRVTIERQTIEADGGTLRGALGILISEKFFDRAREFAEVRAELIRRGFLASKAPNRQISQAIEGLVGLGFLTKEPNGYQAVPGMKIHIVETGKAAAAR